MNAMTKSGGARPIAFDRQVVLPAEDWDRLPVRLGVLLAEHFERYGYAVRNREGEPVAEDSDRLAYFLIGVLASEWSGLSADIDAKVP